MKKVNNCNLKLKYLIDPHYIHISMISREPGRHKIVFFIPLTLRGYCAKKSFFGGGIKLFGPFSIWLYHAARLDFFKGLPAFEIVYFHTR